MKLASQFRGNPSHFVLYRVNFLHPSTSSFQVSIQPSGHHIRMAPRAPVRPEPIPTYRIDLSLPPEQRYLQVATDFGPKMRHITPLFDEVLSSMIPWPQLRRWIEFLASIFLRRVYSSEETRELKGIAKASGVALYILIALNVLLDSLLGCTSGGVMTSLDKKGGREHQEQRRRGCCISGPWTGAWIH